jgi:hypothetical protein
MVCVMRWHRRNGRLRRFIFGCGLRFGRYECLGGEFFGQLQWRYGGDHRADRDWI